MSRVHVEYKATHEDYDEACVLLSNQHTFYGLIIAAMMKADVVNRAKLEFAFPRLHEQMTNGIYVEADQND